MELLIFTVSRFAVASYSTTLPAGGFNEEQNSKRDQITVFLHEINLFWLSVERHVCHILGRVVRPHLKKVLECPLESGKHMGLYALVQLLLTKDYIKLLSNLRILLLDVHCDKVANLNENGKQKITREDIGQPAQPSSL